MDFKKFVLDKKDSLIKKYELKKEEKLVLKKQEKEKEAIHKAAVLLGKQQLKEEKIAPKDVFISLRHINKVYENHFFAVHDFNLDIQKNEFVVFVGPSGCGKSTTLRMIAGLEDITNGDLFIDGKYMNVVEAKDRDIAMVFQSYALYPHLTVYENMAFSLKIKHMNKEEIDKKIKEAAEILQITDYLSRKPAQLSGGQCQRVALGRAIVRNTRIFLMDEPLSNLDAKLRVSMRSEIIKLHNKLNATTIYVTHDQTEAMTMASRIVVMNKGYVQQIGTPQEIYNKPANKFVATFIGSPSMNLLNGVYDNGEFSFGEFKVKFGEDIVKKHDDFYKNKLEEYKNRVIYLDEHNEERNALLLKISDLEKTLKERNNDKKLTDELTNAKKELNILEKASVEKNRLLSYIKDYEEIVKTHKHPLIFGIRPEDIYEISEVTHKVKPSIPFETKVVVAELTGNQYYVHSTLSEEEIVFTSFPDRPIEVNQKMKVVVNLNKFHLFDFVTGNNIIN